MLAELAGVSVGTVSKAFSGSDEISERTRERIFALARQRGCFDKYNKNRFPKKIIAVLCPEIQSDYYTSIAARLDKEIHAHGGISLLSATAFSAENERELFRYYASYCKADGIILVNPSARIDNTVRVPAVNLMPGSQAAKSQNIDQIESDMSDSIRQAVAYLKRLGHTRIGFAGEKKTVTKSEQFKKALAAEGLPIDNSLIRVSSHRFEQAGEEYLESFLRLERRPSAVIAAYDRIAIGLIRSLKKEGLSVPRDLSVIGMDDIAVVPYLDPPLSSIRTNTDNACRIAVELIMKKIDNRYYSTRQKISVPTEFIVRESCGAAKPEPYVQAERSPTDFPGFDLVSPLADTKKY